MAIPLLLEDLNEGEQLNLASLVKHPGFPALEKLHMAACKRATEDVMKLDPEAPDYNEKLKVRAARARERSEFSMLILASIMYHARVPEVREQEKKQEPPKSRFTMPEAAKENQ